MSILSSKKRLKNFQSCCCLQEAEYSSPKDVRKHKEIVVDIHYFPFGTHKHDTKDSKVDKQSIGQAKKIIIFLLIWHFLDHICDKSLHVITVENDSVEIDKIACKRYNSSYDEHCAAAHCC